MIQVAIQKAQGVLLRTSDGWSEIAPFWKRQIKNVEQDKHGFVLISLGGQVRYETHLSQWETLPRIGDAIEIRPKPGTILADLYNLYETIEDEQ